jgi:hypothetical protein
VVLILALGEVFRYILRKGPVTADKLHGALAGYIMIAFLWTFIYALSEGSTSPNETGPVAGLSAWSRGIHG